MSFPTSSASSFAPTSSLEAPHASTSTSVPKPAPTPAPTRRILTRRSGSTGSRSSTPLNDENAPPPGFAATPAGKAALGKPPPIAAVKAGGPGAGLAAGAGAALAAKPAGPLRTSSRATNSILARNGNGPNTATRRRILQGSSGALALKAEAAGASTTTAPPAHPSTAPAPTVPAPVTRATAPRTVRTLPQPASKAASMRGMGVVRTGPAVVGARTSLGSSRPATAPETRRGLVSATTGLPVAPTEPALAAPAPRTSKRSFDVASEEDPSLSATSPQKRRLLPPVTEAATDAPAATRPFDLTSPRKLAPLGSLASPAKSQGPAVFRMHQDTALMRSPHRAAPAFLLERPKSPVRMLVDEDRADEHMIDTEPAVFRPVPIQAGPEDLHDSSSEDEIDWLSPKKPTPKSIRRASPPAMAMTVELAMEVDDEADGAPESPVKAAAVRRSARLSPPVQRKLVTGTSGPVAARPALKRATSVPMEPAPAMKAANLKQTTLPFIPGSPRATSAPPPTMPTSNLLAASAASSLLPPPTVVQPEPVLTVNPALLFQPAANVFSPPPAQRSVTPTNLAPASGLVSKRGLSPIPGSPFHANYRSSPAPPTPGTAMRSFIPRPVAVPPTPAIIPPTPALGSAVSAATSAADAKGAAGSVTSETAARLEKLQAMLGRLAGPRRESAGSSGPSRRDSLTGGGSAGGMQRRTSLVARRPSTAPSSSTGSAMLLQTGDSIVPLREPGPDAPSTTSGPRASMPPVAGRNATAAGRRYSVGMQPPAAAAATPSAVPAAESASPKNKDTSQVLRGVVAFVDVRTTAGDDAGMLFVSMLKDLGARVTTRPVPSLTHIVYKSGRPATLQRAKQPPQGCSTPFLVGIGWVVQCAEKGERVDEAGFKVVEEETGGLAVPMKGKARRSMEPKALASLSSYSDLARVGGGGGEAVKATIAESIAKARLRTLAYKPKVGSPLAKRVSGLSLEDLLKEDEKAEAADVEMA